MFDYLTGARLFDFYQPASVTSDLHLQRIAEYLGPFPPTFLTGCRDREKYFNEQSIHFYIHPVRISYACRRTSPDQRAIYSQSREPHRGL
jgi:hypothetical protein